MIIAPIGTRLVRWVMRRGALGRTRKEYQTGDNRQRGAGRIKSGGESGILLPPSHPSHVETYR